MNTESAVTIYFETLGCPKNEVDTAYMEGMLSQEGFQCIDNPLSAEIIIVNTCGFIESASQESIERILDLSEHKQIGNCKKFIVCGCLVERYFPDIQKELSEVDIFLGTGAFGHIQQAIQNNDPKSYVIPTEHAHTFRIQSLRIIHPQTKTAYLRIAEGCSDHCTYCIIPKLRGPYQSIPEDRIYDEFAQYLQADIKEIILVAQDTAAYGKDLSDNISLSDILTNLSKIIDKQQAKTRIRILYMNPQNIDDRLIHTIQSIKTICAYIDMPVQHASDAILKKMGRPYTKADLCDLIKKIRSNIPNVVLRTSLLVGFPGEKNTHFQELMDFIHDNPFDHLGVFDYSDSHDLSSHHLPDHVSALEKEDRKHAIMTAQAEISYHRQQRYVGQTFDVLAEELSEDTPPLREGRTYFQAPEIDGITLIKGQPRKSGEFYPVRITEAMHYDLIGEIV